MSRLNHEPQTTHRVRAYDPDAGDNVSVIVTGAESSREAVALVRTWCQRVHPLWRVGGCSIEDAVTIDTGTAHDAGLTVQ